MGKRRKNRSGKRGGGAGGGIVRIAFKSFLSTALSSNVLVLALSPANVGSGSITAIYPGFELFRFRKLRVELLPRPALNLLTSGYNADATMGSPGGPQDVMALLDSTVIVGTSTVAGHNVSRSYSVSPKRLKGQVAWYKCTPDASDTALEQQGALVFYGLGASEAINTVLTGEIEFKNPVDPTIASATLKQKLRAELMAEFSALSILPRMPFPVAKTVGN